MEFYLFHADIVKYFQILVNAINLEIFPLFTPKGHPRLCWVIWIIIQSQRTTIITFQEMLSLTKGLII